MKLTFSLFILTYLSFFISGCSKFSTQIRTEIEIEAPPEIVWEIITDTDKYPEWNPYHTKVVRLTNASSYETPKLHDKMQVFIHKPNGKKLDLKVSVLEIEKLKRFYWGGGLPLIFKGEHRFILKPVNSCTTKFHQDEDFWGAALPFVPLGPIDIEKGYRLMNEALKTRAETQFLKDSNSYNCMG